MDGNRSKEFETALARRIEGISRPFGALGRMERIARQVARLQGSLSPVMQSCQLTIFAGDHGIASEGVSASAPDATRQRVRKFAGGGAAASVVARQNGLALQLVNAGTRGGGFDMAEVVEHSLGPGTASFLHRPAMARVAVAKALQTGRRLGAAGRFDAMAFGEMGIGNTSSAALLAHRLVGTPLSDLVGRGSGLDDDGLMHKHAVLQQASARVPGPLDPHRALEEFGGYEIAMMAGAMMGAAEARRLVLVDGYIATAAALVAAALEPESRAAMVFCLLSTEAGHEVLLDAMSARPLLSLDMRMGEGVGAALAWPIVTCAVAMFNDMAAPDGDPHP